MVKQVRFWSKVVGLIDKSFIGKNVVMVDFVITWIMLKLRKYFNPFVSNPFVAMHHRTS